MNLKEFFNDSPILITGASGFVGQNLFTYLKSQDLNVIGTYNEHPKSDLVKCDLTNYEQTKQLLIDNKIDYIIHLASKSYGAGVMSSNPSSLVRGTIHMNSNVLDLAYQLKIKKCLFVSSSTLYQEANYPISEDQLDLNKDPFHLYLGIGGSKRYSEQLCKFYNTLGLNVNIIRPTNIFGPMDKYSEGVSHFTPAIIKRALEAKDELLIWGTGYSVRNMFYIDDMIRDLLLVFTKYNKCEPINVCSDTTANIREIVHLICKLLDKELKIIYDPTKPDAIPYRNLNRTKFDSLFGKRSYTPLEEGLKKTIEWMKQELAQKGKN